MTKLYCAQCGMQILTLRKAIQRIRKIIELVEPHSCEDGPQEIEELKNIELTPVDRPTPRDKELNKMFDDFKFGEKISEINTATKLDASTGDRRTSEHTRKELPSSAPRGLLDQMKDHIGTHPRPDNLEEGQSEPEEDSDV